MSHHADVERKTFPAERDDGPTLVGPSSFNP
jgi:hypothetical protein